MTTQPPRTAECRALRSRRVVKSSALKSTRSGTSDVMKTPKTQLNLKRLEQDNGLWQKTTSKTSWKDAQKYSPFRRDHVGDGLDEQVEREIVEQVATVGVRSTSMASRVKAAIVLKKRQITASRLVSSALQSLHDEGAKLVRSISVMARFAMSPSVFGF